MTGVAKGVISLLIIFLLLSLLFVFVSEYVSQLTATNLLHTTTDMLFDCVISETQLLLARSDWYSLCSTDFNNFESDVKLSTSAWNTVFNDIRNNGFSNNPTQYGMTFLPRTYLQNNLLIYMTTAMRYNVEGVDVGAVKNGHMDINSANSGKTNYLNDSQVLSNAYFEVIKPTINITLTQSVQGQDSEFYRTFLSRSQSNTGSSIDTDIGNDYVDEIVVYEVNISFDYVIPYLNYFVREATGTYGRRGTYHYRNVYFVAR